MKYLFTLLLFIYGSISFSIHAQCPVIPSPSSYEEYEGEINVNSVLIDTTGVPEGIVNFLKSNLEQVWGCKVVKGGQESLIRFVKVPSGTDGYFLEVKKRIYIGYPTDDLAFYGAVSLLQMIEKGNNGLFIRKSRIQDKPKFQWRGLHLDVSRHFFNVQEVKRFIDLMALYKFNKFHWHLTDDQGWRIEIKKYPKLTSIGAFRDSTLLGHYSDLPRVYDGEEYGGFYTQEDVKEIVQYAKTKYIDVIPEIELPGHSRAALAAYPEYSCTGVNQPVPLVWGIFDDIYCSKDETIEFMKDILSEVVELFPSDYIHIGGDEAPKTRWKKCKDCQRVIKNNNLKDEHELQSYFIGEMDAYLTSKGRKLIGWDEILEGGLSPNAAVMSWRGEQGGIDAAKQGHYVVMSPTTYCYFDYYQSSHAIEPLAIGGYLPLEKVYQYNPIPKELNKEEQRFILGGQANLWTEYISTFEQLEYMTYPRALALSQSLWSTAKPSYEEFLAVYLKYQENYLTRNGVNYAKSIHYPELVIKRSGDGIDNAFKGVKEVTEFSVGFRDFAEIIEVDINNPIHFDRSQDNIAQLIAMDVWSPGIKEKMVYSFKFHSAVGLEIEMLTAPHPKYNHNGSLNLVDGIEGSLPWKGSEWLGFRDSIVEFIIDLDEVAELKGLSLGFLEQNGSWIYLPENVVIKSSTDKSNWKKVSDVAVKGQMIDGRFDVDFNSNSRYLKVSIRSIGIIPEGQEGGGHAPWTFIDEIEIVK